MSKTIPEIRARLHELAEEFGCRELHELADDTKRRFFGRVARAKAKRITEEMVAEIRHTHKTSGGHQRDIAKAYGIDQGRVNEILHGYRDGTPFKVKRI